MSYFKTQDDLLQFHYFLVTLKMEVVPKGTNQLETKHGMCCLGVAQACSSPDPLVIGGYLDGGFPSKHYNSPDWLIRLNTEFKNRFGEYLFRLNDIHNLPHSKIADHIAEAFKPELGHLYDEYIATFK